MVFYDSIKRVTFIFELILTLAGDSKRSISHFGNIGLKLISHFTLCTFILQGRAIRAMLASVEPKSQAWVIMVMDGKGNQYLYPTGMQKENESDNNITSLYRRKDQGKKKLTRKRV